MPPRLTIIAGPNGAGKSLFSSTLVKVNTFIFDGDKYLSSLRKDFPETGSFELNSYVNEHYSEEAKEKAIKNRTDFSFETNFSGTDPISSFTQFKKAGYQTHLIFIGMDLMEDCIQRVSIRVKSGGHKVPETEIQYNFHQGLVHLYAHYAVFDLVTIMDNSIPDSKTPKIPEKIFEWSEKKIKLFTNNKPEWVQLFLKHLAVD